MIRWLSGDDLGVPRIPEALVVEWTEGGHRVVFSFARLGDAMTAHFAAEKSSLREIKTAIDDFVQWIFYAYPWSRAVFAVTGRQSIGRLVQKCGFGWLTRRHDYDIYMRMKP